MDVSDSIFNNLMMFVSTEESAQGQGPQEPDPVQHADAPEERQAKGEVRFCLSAAFRKYPVLADFSVKHFFFWPPHERRRIPA